MSATEIVLRARNVSDLEARPAGTILTDGMESRWRRRPDGDWDPLHAPDAVPVQSRDLPRLTAHLDG